MYRLHNGRFQVLLAHPGGPFFQGKDEGSWTIPKGEPNPDETLFDADKREFEEETGFEPTGPFVPLTPVKQKGGKIVHAWAFVGDCDPTVLVSNTFLMVWPLKSGQQIEFPEMDKAESFDLEVARRKINSAQVALVDELEAIVTKADRKMPGQ
jgi:predicted NUDIX family NTP pyrophosphohydrolase